MFSANKIASALLLLYTVSNGQVSRAGDVARVDPLTKQVRNYQDTAYDFLTALDDFTRTCGVPTGIDLEMPLKQRRLSVDVSRGTVIDVLNAIVAQEPSYKWVKVNGVINVMPEEHENSILDLRIPHLQLANADSSGVHAAIVSLPEVKEWLEQNHLTERTPNYMEIIVGKNRDVMPRVSLDLHDMTLREILNRILKSCRFHSWVVARWGEKNQYLSIGVN